MSDLTLLERIKIEKLLEMHTGYVLDFSNSTFQEFVAENSKVDIYDERYNLKTGSKANRLRAYLKLESNTDAGVLLEALFEYWVAGKFVRDQGIEPQEQRLLDECRAISQRLIGSGPPLKKTGCVPKVISMSGRLNFTQNLKIFHIWWEALKSANEVCC